MGREVRAELHPKVPAVCRKALRVRLTHRYIDALRKVYYVWISYVAYGIHDLAE